MLVAALAGTAAAACPAAGPSSPPSRPAAQEDRHQAARRDMVREQIEARGVKDPMVLEAMRSVPRHLLVPEGLRDLSYQDRPLPIGEGQTISQPYIVALMTELARVRPGDKVLEVGTGSGYQAAVLAALGAEVHTIEIVEVLAERARRDLTRLGYGSVRFRTGDGYRGWPEAAPFRAILVTAAPDHVPQPLVDQLEPGGRMVIPVGQPLQSLVVVTRTESGARREEILPVRFVPMTGEAQRRGGP
ncbi:MAG TPA: protein-L-isoaspartate(D-aspartate) O-methyltransferase [Candidatus Polarisedimenticolia bacterium]|nr:protein-L-isoaspartate(D-aspartate) O-methyltransferase [Candidatus Polarisedimenticolia bacterium]